MKKFIKEVSKNQGYSLDGYIIEAVKEKHLKDTEKEMVIEE